MARLRSSASPAPLLCLLLASAASASAPATISNTLPRRSTSGAIMDAHSGPILRWPEPGGAAAYYWYASSYGDCVEPPQNESGCTPWPPPPNGCGFRDDHFVSLFVSRDLATWEDRGAVMRMADLPHGGPDGLPAGSIMYSPIVIFDKAAARYVLWFNYVLPDFSGSFIAIATSAAREGPFALAVANVTLAHAATGDFDILLDDDGASAFIIYTAHIFGPGPAHLMSVERLAPGFMASAGENSGFFGDAGVEAPSIWRRGDTYHASFGQTCCFCTEGSDAVGYTAPAPLGPWTRRGVIGGGASTGRIRAQQSAVFPWLDAAANETAFMWWGARWQTAPDLDKGECEPSERARMHECASQRARTHGCAAPPEHALCAHDCVPPSALRLPFAFPPARPPAAHDFSFFFPLSFREDGSVAEMTWIDSFQVSAA